MWEASMLGKGKEIEAALEFSPERPSDFLQLPRKRMPPVMGWEEEEGVDFKGIWLGGCKDNNANNHAWKLQRTNT
jgi:hypothetical protein